MKSFLVQAVLFVTTKSTYLYACSLYLDLFIYKFNIIKIELIHI